MPWYTNPRNLGYLAGGVGAALTGADTPGGSGSAGNTAARGGLASNGAAAQGFAQQGAAGYAGGTQSLTEALRGVREQASGERSVSRETLRQALQQNVSAQQSAAAGAAPANQPMAARTAAIQSGRLQSGLAGQQAIASMQEQNAAQQALVQALLGQRGQDLNATLGGYNASSSAYGGAVNPNDDKSWSEKNAALLSAGASAASLSDERQKKGIVAGAPAAAQLLEALKGYSYEYKPGAATRIGGAGPQLGVMAQDVQKVIPSAVASTPAGKVIDTGKVATALASTLPTIHDRVKRLEAAGPIAKNETLDPYSPTSQLLREGRKAPPKLSPEQRAALLRELRGVAGGKHAA